MSKFIDLDILLDAKVDKFGQSTLKAGENGILVSPIMSGVPIEDAPGVVAVGMKYDNTLKKWMISDGTEWKPFSSSDGSAVSSEIISFTRDHLTDGKLTVEHGFTGDQKYLIGLDYTLMPKSIEYADGSLILDYSDQPSTGDLTGEVWFLGSQQSMLAAPPAKPEYVLSGCADETVNGAYYPIEESDWSKHIPQKAMDQHTILHVWVNANDEHVLMSFAPSKSTSVLTVAVVPSGWGWNDIPPYRTYIQGNVEPTDLSSLKLTGNTSTITITKYTEG